MRRRPACDARVTWASETSSGGAVSAAGEALQMLPPTVPTDWVCQPPTVRAAAASAG